MLTNNSHCVAEHTHCAVILYVIKQALRRGRVPQLRQNIITGEWVVITPERSQRPHDFKIPSSHKNESGTEKPCVFCVGSPAYQTRIHTYESNIIYVIPNKYPAFVENPEYCSMRSKIDPSGFYTTMPSVGGHDVVIVKDHDCDIYSFSTGIWTELFLMTKRRYEHWRENRTCDYSMMIYNHGVPAGASIDHPHAQIFASNIIPSYIIKEIKGSKKYYNSHKSCVYCDLIVYEQKQKVRIVAENDLFFACTFYAARFPYEVWVLPKHHQSHFDSEGQRTLIELAQIMHVVFEKIGKTLNNPPLNFYIHDSPTRDGEKNYYHWHIEITPRLSHYGGYEIGSEVVIDVQSPENTAEYLNS